MKFKTEVSGGGSFFKAKEHTDCKALLVEPKSIGEQQGKFGTREVATADITVFRNTDELTGKGEPNVLLGSRVDGAALVREIKALLADGAAGIYKVDLVPNPKGTHPIPVFNSVDKTIQEYVIAYAKKRDEKVNAVELPDF